MGARGAAALLSFFTRVVALAALLAFRGVLKDPAFRPRVAPRHAPYKGLGANAATPPPHPASKSGVGVPPAAMMDHAVALAFAGLDKSQQDLIRLVQCRMDFNFGGRLAQGEAPPGPLFSSCKTVLQGAPSTDVSFYFAHWFAEFAGADPSPWPWPGSVRAAHFPARLLRSFFESLDFVTEHLPGKTETQTAETYLQWRWDRVNPPLPLVAADRRVAALRLALMAQGIERACVAALGALSAGDREVLCDELART
eukprot:gene4250-16922_t